MSRMTFLLLIVSSQTVLGQDRDPLEHVVSNVSYADTALIVLAKQQVHIIRFSDSKCEFAARRKGVTNGVDFATVKYDVQTHEVDRKARLREGRLSLRVTWKNNEGTTDENNDQIAFPGGSLRWSSGDVERGYIYFFPDDLVVLVVHKDFNQDNILAGLLKKNKK